MNPIPIPCFTISLLTCCNAINAFEIISLVLGTCLLHTFLTHFGHGIYNFSFRLYYYYMCCPGVFVCVCVSGEIQQNNTAKIHQYNNKNCKNNNNNNNHVPNIVSQQHHRSKKQPTGGRETSKISKVISDFDRTKECRINQKETKEYKRNIKNKEEH